MNVIMLSPGYPGEMPHFTRGLAEVGATVLGVGDQPPGMVPAEVRPCLDDYLMVRNFWDEDGVVEQVTSWVGDREVQRVECLWEPLVVLAARLRKELGAAGIGVEQAVAFRNKERMKQVLDAAGIRTPRHVAANSIAEAWEAVEEIGFPVILKPIAGSGSADTYRVESKEELDRVLPRLRHVPLVSVEEFVDGEEYTYDTISIAGEPAFHNVAWYRPRPLVARSNEWISPQVIALRDPDDEALAGGVEMGKAVLFAMGFESGFTHMEWYRKSDGEVVFGEIAARPPGAHQVDQMNYACDVDVFRGWAEAVCFGRFSEDVERRFNVATIYKRARGTGTIQAIHGLGKVLEACGPSIVWENLLPVGSPRRDWRKTLVSDGFIMLRHPEIEPTLEMADLVGSELHLFAE